MVARAGIATGDGVLDEAEYPEEGGWEDPEGALGQARAPLPRRGSGGQGAPPRGPPPPEVAPARAPTSVPMRSSPTIVQTSPAPAAALKGTVRTRRSQKVLISSYEYGGLRTFFITKRSERSKCLHLFPSVV